MSVINFPFYGNAIYGAFINLPTGVPDGTMAITLDTYSLWVYQAGSATWTGVNSTPTTPVLLPNGSAAAPSLAFQNSPTTGVYRVGADSVGFSAATSLIAGYGALGNWFFGQAQSVSTTMLVKIAGANISGGTGGYGINCVPTCPAAFTSGVEAVYANVATAASAFTAGYAIALSAGPATAGAGSTITRAIGVYALPQTVGGTGNAAIADNLAFSGSYFINSSSTNQSKLSGVLSITAGAVGAPALNFGDATTGFYKNGTNGLSVTTAGVLALTVDSSQVATFAGKGVFAAAGFRAMVSTANTSNPPTNAELISAFGAAATVGSGFMAIVDDNAGHSAEYVIFSDGTKYWQVTATAAA